MPAKKHNGSSAEAELNLDHELPPAEENNASALQPDAEAGGKVAPAEDLETQLERVRSERAAYLDRAARIQAEFENYRKRSEKQQQEFKEYALAGAMTTLLPILDSLDRALNTKAASLEDFHSGIELIDKQFYDALAKLGCSPCRQRANRSIPMCSRRSRWWTPTKSRTTTCSMSCSVATS